MSPFASESSSETFDRQGSPHCQFQWTFVTVYDFDKLSKTDFRKCESRQVPVPKVFMPGVAESGKLTKRAVLAWLSKGVESTATAAWTLQQEQSEDNSWTLVPFEDTFRLGRSAPDEQSSPFREGAVVVISCKESPPALASDTAQRLVKMRQPNGYIHDAVKSMSQILTRQMSVKVDAEEKSPWDDFSGSSSDSSLEKPPWKRRMRSASRSGNDRDRHHSRSATPKKIREPNRHLVRSDAASCPKTPIGKPPVTDWDEIMDSMDKEVMTVHTKTCAMTASLAANPGCGFRVSRSATSCIVSM